MCGNNITITLAVNTDPLHGILVGIKGCKYETCNYETSPWHSYAGSPMAITLGQQYTVGEMFCFYCFSDVPAWRLII